MLDYAGIISSFKLKKYIADYIRLYKLKKVLYHDTFSKYI